jgi:hypothetical protein
MAKAIIVWARGDLKCLEQFIPNIFTLSLRFVIYLKLHNFDLKYY